MRTQDVRYIASKAATEARKAERLASSLHAVGVVDRPPASHLVFVDDAPAVARFDPVAHFDTPASLLGRAHNRPRRAAVEGGGGDVPGWLPLAVPTAARPTPVLAVRPRHAPGAVDAYAVGDAVEAAHGSAWWPATVESVDGGASAAVVRLAPAAGGPPDPVLTLPPAQLRPAPAAGDPWGGGVAAPVGERVHPEEWAKRVGPPRPHLVQGFAVDAATLVSTFERAPGAGASGEGAAEALVRVASAV
jgi:hypothetical protein